MSILVFKVVPFVFQIGGATAQIGDPSGRKTERPQLTVSEVKANSQKILENLNRIFSNHKEYFWNEQNKSSLPPIRYVTTNVY